MKKTTLTEKKAEQTPTGGVLVGKRKGQTIIHDKGTMSGYLVGKTHAEGGIKAVNKSTGQPLEMQGGEVVITAPAVADQTKNEFNGKMMTNREILSQINVNGGGVAFADGGEISKVKHTGASYNYGGRTMTDFEIIQEINSCYCEHSEFDKGGDVDFVTYKEKYNKKYNYRKNKSHSLKEISKDTGVSMKGLRQIYNKGIGAYKTNPSSVRPNVKSKEQWAMARVYSAVMGGKASKVDSNELKMNKGGNLSKGKSFPTIAKMHGVSMEHIMNQVKLGLKVESEHTDDEREQMRIVKDHLVENPDYYTILKKAGLEKGGSFKKIENLSQEDLKLYDRVSSIRSIDSHHNNRYITYGGLNVYSTVESPKNVFVENTDIVFNNWEDAKSYVNNNEIKESKIPFWVGTEKRYYELYPEKKGIYNNGGKLSKEDLVRNSKKGDHPARDLNNYNDVLDIDADGVFGAETGLYSDGGDIDIETDGTGGADASAGVGAFKDGGELDFLDDVERIFDEGGSTDLPKVEYVTITSVGNRTVYSELVGEIYGNIEVLKYDLNKFFKEKNEIPSYIYIQPNDSSNSFGIAFKKGKNTVLNFNPLTGQNSDIIKQLDRRYPRSIKKFDWNDFYQNKNRPSDKQEPKKESSAPASTSGNQSGKFSSGLIDAFNQIDEILKEQNIDIENVDDSLDYFRSETTKDFDVVNTLTGEVFLLRSFSKHLGVAKEDENIKKSILLLKYFKEWKKSNPTSASGAKGKTIDLSQTKIWVGDDLKLSEVVQKKAFDLGWQWESNPKKEFHKDGQKALFFFADKSILSGDKDTFDSVTLKEIFASDLLGSAPTSASESKEQAKQEEQSIRNFELEKKYLTQRINALSSELDLKRPILSNEEIAFYQREINKFVSKLRVVSNDEMELKPIQARVNGVYKVKWGDYTKQYPETDVLSINGVKSELTFEEYLTVRTPEFKSFFGNWEQAYFDNTYSGVSKIINPKTKEPMPVFHGTNVLFTEWKTYETNNAHYFAVKREMSDFFATSWETRSDKAGVDSKAIKALNPNTGTFLYRCFLDIRNPIDFSKFGVEKRPIKEFLLFLKINYNIGDYDFWTNLGNAKGFTSETRVYAWQIIRLWQNFTKYVKNFTTYDGYIFYEYIPDTPFGGLENASLSFCAFESNQIKFADAYEFNALSNDSRFDFGGTL